MSKKDPIVGIIMGSKSDWKGVMEHCSEMLKEFGGENIFQGRVIEVHIGTLPSDQAFTFTDWTAEMKAKASICISPTSLL